MALLELGVIFGNGLLSLLIVIAGLALIWNVFSMMWRWLGRAIRHGREHATEELDREIR
jgi:hypothetical protein